MAEKLGELYHALVMFGIPTKECETFVLSLTKESHSAKLICKNFLVKHKHTIEAGSIVLSQQIGQQS